MSRVSIPLTKSEAFARGTYIKPNIKYKLFFCLRKGETYEGWSRIQFDGTCAVRFTLFEGVLENSPFLLDRPSRL